MEGFGAWLVKKRLEAGMDQSALIRASGLSSVTVSKLENDRSPRTSIETLTAYSRAVGVSVVATTKRFTAFYKTAPLSNAAYRRKKPLTTMRGFGAALNKIRWALEELFIEAQRIQQPTLEDAVIFSRAVARQTDKLLALWRENPKALNSEWCRDEVTKISRVYDYMARFIAAGYAEVERQLSSAETK